MTYKQMQRIVTRMNNGTASAAMEAKLAQYADIAWAYCAEDKKFKYMIKATYSYSL